VNGTGRLTAAGRLTGGWSLVRSDVGHLRPGAEQREVDAGGDAHDCHEAKADEPLERTEHR
jgi:hypothetical protein